MNIDEVLPNKMCRFVDPIKLQIDWILKLVHTCD